MVEPINSTPQKENEMRKTVLIFLVLFLSLSALTFKAHISIPNTDANVGSIVEIPINVKDASGIAGFQATVTYDASVVQATGVTVGELTSGWMITPNIKNEGQISVVGIDTSLKGLQGSSGSLVKLKFKIVGQSGKRSNLKFTMCKLSDTSGVEIPSNCKQGSIKINNK